MHAIGPVTGRPAIWARDMAIIGGVSSLVAPSVAVMFSLAPPGYPSVAAVVGAVTGGAVGWCMPTVLERVRGRIPIALLLASGMVVGLAWGIIVGGIAGAIAAPALVQLSVLCAGVGGLLQFALSWFPYTFQTVRRGRTWPVVLCACLVTPLVGVACISSAFAVLF